MSVTLVRGATTWTCPGEPRLVTRYDEGGPPRAVAISLPGSPIVTEYEQASDRRQLVLRWEAVGSAEMANLRTLLDASGPMTLTYDNGSTATVVFGPESEQSIEPVFAHLPYGAPNQLWYWRVQLTLYLV